MKTIMKSTEMNPEAPTHWDGSTALGRATGKTRRGRPANPIPVAVTEISVSAHKRIRRRNTTGLVPKPQSRVPLTMTGRELLLLASRKDPSGCEGVKAVLNQLGLSYWIGPDQDRDGSYGVFVSNGLSSQCDMSWPDEEQLSVFLKHWPSRIWEKAYAAGRTDAKVEIRKALGF